VEQVNNRSFIFVFHKLRRVRHRGERFP